MDIVIPTLESLSPVSITGTAAKPTGKKKKLVTKQTKAEAAAKLAVHKPATVRAKVHELKEFLFTDNRAELLMQRMYSVAMDDKHPDSFPALKFLNERILPMSAFEKGKGSTGIQINITNATGNRTPVNVTSAENPSDNDDISDISFTDVVSDENSDSES